MTNTARKAPSPRTLAKLNAEKLTHERAFELVTPQKRGASWKDQIGEYVTLAEIVQHDVTLTQIQAAIVFYTATVPRVLTFCVGDTLDTVNDVTTGVTFASDDSRGALLGYVFIADGYRRGPAGDG